MHYVFAPDANTLRGLLDRPKQLLKHPFCGYLIYLARSVDESGIAFLNRFSSAIDVETGEALAFLVLLDTAVLRGTGFSKLPLGDPRSLPTIEIPEAVDGSRPLQDAVAYRLGDMAVPFDALYRASPEWSLKFADHIGLDRSYLPCIVAMDDPAASADDRCAVVSLADPDAAWETLKAAIAPYVAQPDTQKFMLAAEQVRTAERRFAQLRRTWVPDWRGDAKRLVSQLPPTPDAVLDWVAALDAADGKIIARAAGDSEAFRALLASPPSEESRRDLGRTLRKVRGVWLRGPRNDNPQIRRMMATELTTLLRRLGRPDSDLDGLGEMTERADRQAFLTRAAAAPFTVEQLHECWDHLDRHVRPEILRLADTTATARREAVRRAVTEATVAVEQARSELASTPRTPFVPHLIRTAAVEPARERKRSAGVTVATGVTAFLADIVQILQGIGVIR